MPWQTAVAIQLQAGDTIINPSGIFVYSGAPAAGNLIFSAAPASGSDTFGNSFVEGGAAYIVSGGSTFALQLGNQGTGGAAFFIHNQSSAPNADPGYSANLASPSAGCVAEITSGKGQVGDAAASLLIGDSRSSAQAGGLIQLVCGATLLNSSAVASIPATAPTLASLPNDNNSGSTWVAGERAFMNNNWVANVNSNFAAIKTALVNAGIWS